ncbi:MAG: hypothetical protein AAGN46_07205 [Acidobacteriota bacterium]
MTVATSDLAQAPSGAALRAALAELVERAAGRRSVRFLLGTDEHIDRETRVAFAPRHLRDLRTDLAGLGLEVEMAVVAGAGERASAAFSDAAYVEAGATLVTLDELPSLAPFDVVHALKEPTEWEATLAAPFLRVGALHLASKPPGVCTLLRERPFAAIFDGATIGGCSFRLTGGDRTPIVGSMSRFAGRVAGRRVAEATAAAGLAPGRVVVVGAGIAGMAAISQLVDTAAPLVVVEPWEPTRRRLDGELRALGFDRVEMVETLDDDGLAAAIGVVFAHRSGARAAEKVCREEHIRQMVDGAAIADIAIDQGGAIAHAGYREDDDAATARRKYIELFGDTYSYYAEVNMPREHPEPASELHGDSSLIYIETLLALCAVDGGPEGVVDRLLGRDVHQCASDERVADDLLDAVLQDLRNGLQIARVASGDGHAVRIADPAVAEHRALVEWVHACAAS